MESVMEAMKFADVIQGGSFALVVGIVGWLMYWFPKWTERYAKTREVEAESRTQVARESRESVREVATAHATVHDKALQVYQEENRAERDGCERRTKEERDASERRHKELLEKLVSMETKNDTLHQQTRHTVVNLEQKADFNRMIQQGLRDLQANGREVMFDGDRLNQQTGKPNA